MINLMKLSNSDLAMFFDHYHDQISTDLEQFAAQWTPGDYRDDWLATRAAVQHLSMSGLVGVCIPERYQGRQVNNPDEIDARSITLARECLGYLDGLLDCAFAMQGL